MSVFKVQEGVQSSVQRGQKTIASLAVVQIACLVAEAVLSTAEYVCGSLMVNGKFPLCTVVNSGIESVFLCFAYELRNNECNPLT